MIPYKIISIPENLDKRLFLESMLSDGFLLYYDFFNSSLLIFVRDKEEISRLAKAFDGLLFEIADCEPELSDLEYITFYGSSEDVLGTSNICRIFEGFKGGLFLSFSRADSMHIRQIKSKIEKLMSDKGVRITKNADRNILGYGGHSEQKDLYYDSEERKIYLSILDNLDEISLSNGLSYKVSIILNGNIEKSIRYLESRSFIFEHFKITARDIASLFDIAKKTDAMPFSYNLAAGFWGFPESVKREHIIETYNKKYEGDLLLGKCLHNSANETENSFLLSSSTLNLGTLMTGMPGTGKTMAAMNLILQIKMHACKHVIIVSPTEEWSAFGAENGIQVVNLSDERLRINFFKCEKEHDIIRFYENLAMLLSSASDAGPYKSSMEKCLLDAFSRIYNDNPDPDPQEVYFAIEESVIEQHGKKTHTGVKYTKHGENIKAALESLRLMLLKPQFAYNGGLNFSELMNEGVIFDLSHVSNTMKPFFYAMILNKIYEFSDSLDVYGDSKLRMVIGIEEAQLIFENSEKSAATTDLKQRIQDFRKKGVGLLLITHAVTDINVSIRRLCQTKFYFRQSAETAKAAASDLIFNEDRLDQVIDKLKTMGQKICAVNCIIETLAGKTPDNSVFIKTSDFQVPVVDLQKTYKKHKRRMGNTIVKILIQNMPASGIKAEIRYIGMPIFKGETSIGGIISTNRPLKDKKLEFIILKERAKDCKHFNIVGGSESIIKMD